MRAPTQIPPLWLMLEEIPFSYSQIASYLGISARTLERYRNTGNAPRAVQMALFWETKWGRSLANADAMNEAMYMRGLAQSLTDQLAESRKQVVLLEQALASNSYAANGPIYKVV